jgi:integrase
METIVMPGKQAQAIAPPMLRRMLRHASRSPFPKRDRVMVLLSIKAGMRACEIANLDWSMVLDARGRISDTLAIRDAISKKGSGRRVPLHPDLRRALLALLRETGPTGAVIRSARGSHMRPSSVVNWFAFLFAALGFEGCSSHSGRRTFITNAARNIHRTGCSLRVSSSWLATARSRRPSDTSTATPAGRGGWSVCSDASLSRTFRRI